MRHLTLVTGLGLRPHRRRAFAIVYIATVLLILVGVVGLAADTAYVYLTGQRLQVAADAAALAGAQEVEYNSTQAVTNAISAAAANTAAGAAVQLNSATDVQVGNYVRATATFTANTAPYNACKVTANRTTGSLGGPLNLIFGPVFGIKTSNVSRTAVAMDAAGGGAGVICLDPTASPALELTGTGSNPNKVAIVDGDMVVDSNSSTAVQWTGHPYVVAANFDITGNDIAVNSSSVFPSGQALLNQTPTPDPLASLPPPTKPAAAGSGNPLPPGYYPNGLGAGTLAGGIYWIDNGIILKGNSVLDATAGCLLYLHTGGISMVGNSTIVVAPLASGTYAGISFYQDRSNTSAVTLKGTTGQTSSGRLYFPAAPVTIQGTPNCFGTQLICDTLNVQGDAQLNIDYNPSLNPPTHIAYLVQ